MTRSTNSRILFIILSLFLATSYLFAEDISDAPDAPDAYEAQFCYAEKLATNGMKKEAALEYKRYLFLQQYSAGTHKQEALSFLVDYYDSNGDANTALDYQVMMVNELKQQSQASEQQQAQEVQLQAQKKLMLMQKSIASTSQTKNKLPSQYNNLSTIELQESAWSESTPLPLRTTACCCILLTEAQQNNWLALQNDFEKVTSTLPTLFSAEETEAMLSYITAATSFKPKKPMTAAWLSLLPGLGQLYAHNVPNALNAFLVNGTTIGLSVYSLSTLNFLDFTAFEMNPLFQFYRGNLYNAQRDVYTYNAQVTSTLRAPILKIIESHLPE